MLHIVNGDSFAASLRESGIQGDILVWRESLYEGPLSIPFTDELTREKRLRYFMQQGVPQEQFRRSTEEQEEALRGHVRYEEVVLWFEHDLYDQTMLIYLLQWFYKYHTGKNRLYLLCIDSFPGVHSFKGLGQLTPEQTKTLQGSWLPVADAQLELASKVWQAYASPEPAALAAQLQEDLTPLPFLQNALRCHLRRFPSYQDGLNQLERLTLKAIGAGATNPLELFRSVADLVPEYGLGDVQYWDCLSTLRGGKHSLIKSCGPALPNYGHQSAPEWTQWSFDITPLGLEVLEGRADAIAERGIDRWLGGVHLLGSRDIWRWDAAEELVRKK